MLNASNFGSIGDMDKRYRHNFVSLLAGEVPATNLMWTFVHSRTGSWILCRKELGQGFITHQKSRSNKPWVAITERASVAIPLAFLRRGRQGTTKRRFMIMKDTGRFSQFSEGSESSRYSRAVQRPEPTFCLSLQPF